MIRPTATAVTPFVRRLVLGTAFLIGLVFALAPRTPAVQAQETRPAPAADARSQPPSKTITISNEPGVGAKIEIKESADATGDAAAKAGADDTGLPPAAGRPADGGRGAGKGKRVVVTGVGTDREFDSFGEFVHNEPEIAGMVVAIVAVVFLSPVLAIALVLWYRFRKARLLNETMVKLAERGIVPSAEALDALATGSRASRVTVVREPAAAGAAAAPEQTTRIVIGRRTAWSDLRKGVIMSGIGLALSFYSLLEDREPNAIGLILLFVGIGFVVLWWFEERRLAPSTTGAPTDASGSPSA